MRWTTTMGVTAFAITATFIGTNVVAMRFSNAELAPFWGAALRFGPAAALFLAIALVTRSEFPAGRALWGTVAFGVLDVAASFGLVYYGLVEATAAAGAITLASLPLVTALLAWAHRIEPFTWRRGIGGALALAGIAVLAGSPGGAAPMGSLVALLLGVLCLGEGLIILRFIPDVHPVPLNGVAMAVGAVLLVALSWALGEPWALPALPETSYALMFLAIPGTVVVFFLYVSLAQNWGPSSTAYVLVVSPIVASVMAAALRDEPLTRSIALSIVLVGAGVYVGVLRGTSGTRPAAAGSDPRPR